MIETDGGADSKKEYRLDRVTRTDRIGDIIQNFSRLLGAGVRRRRGKEGLTTVKTEQKLIFFCPSKVTRKM